MLTTYQALATIALQEFSKTVIQNDGDEPIIVERHLHPTAEVALREILEFVQQRL